MTPPTLGEWHPRRPEGPDLLAMLERKLRVETRIYEGMVAACAPSIMRDHQSGRVAMLKELAGSLSEQRRVVGE